MISTELVDTRDNSHLWGEQYNRRVTDLLAIQDEIVKQISGKLRLRLSGDDQRRLTKRYTENTEAYQLYLKGLYYWNKRTEESLKKGSEYFQQAIDIDPNYALAYSGLADSASGLSWYGFVAPQKGLVIAKPAALKALEVDDTLAEAHASLLLLRYELDWDWPAAEAEFRRATGLNPRYANAHHWYADYLSAMGRHDEAVLEAKRAQELDPLSLIINTWLGRRFYLARQYDRAIEQCRKTIDMDPSFLPAHLHLGLGYEQKKMYKEAIAEFQTAISLSDGSPIYVAAVGHAYATEGRKSEALKVLDQLKELSKRRYVSAYWIAQIYAALGEKEQAFEWLRKAYEERSVWMVYLKVDPGLDPLRSDPRFQELVRRMNFPP
jgi:tetratricopeptide (TPR) repeat protein